MQGRDRKLKCQFFGQILFFYSQVGSSCAEMTKNISDLKEKKKYYYYVSHISDWNTFLHNIMHPKLVLLILSSWVLHCTYKEQLKVKTNREMQTTTFHFPWKQSAFLNIRKFAILMLNEHKGRSHPHKHIQHTFISTS